MKKTILLAVYILMSLTLCAKRVHTIGDSTMQTYDPEKTPIVGWGQVLEQFFCSDSVSVNNKAVSGTSSKSFYKTYWPKMVDAIEPGDIVIIQFAHNDEKSSGEDGDLLYEYYLSKGDSAAAAAQERRGTSPYNTYRQQLRTYVNEVKARGARAIIASSICRITFDATGHITRSGRHDLGGGSYLRIENDTLVRKPKLPLSDHTMDYVWNAEQTALEYDDVPFINLTTPTDSLWSQLGESYCIAKIFPSGDRTHPMEMGSTLVAQHFIEAVVAGAAGAEPDSLRRAVLQDLADDVRAYKGIHWTPEHLQVDTVISGMLVDVPVRLTGFSLDSLSGNVEVCARHGSLLSIDGQDYSTSLTIPYEPNTLLATVHVRYLPHLQDPDFQEEQDTLWAIHGQDTFRLPIVYPIQAIAAEEGLPVSLCYPLATNQLGEVQGAGIMPGIRLEGLKHYKFYDVASGSPMWYLIRTNTDTKSWPGGETDTCGSRYVELIYAAPAGLELHLDTLHLNLSMTSSGSQMCAKVYYSLQEDFSDAQYACGYEHLKSWKDHYVGAPLQIVLQPGQRLYVRVYPWLDATEETPNRWFCLSQVTVSGRALEPIQMLKNAIQIGQYWYQLYEADHTAAITFRGETYTSYANEYQGDIWIPDSVVFRGQTYTVNTIGQYAFYDSQLRKLRLPASLEYIESNGIRNCALLDTLDCYSPQPIRVDSGSVLNLSPRLVVIVNPGTKELWEAERWWSRYTIVERGSTTDNPGIATALEAPEQRLLPRKILMDGRLYIMIGDAIYSPSGTLVYRGGDE